MAETIHPGDLPDPGIEPGSPALEADALTSEPLLAELNSFLEWVSENQFLRL